jgi:putative transposase
LLGDVAEVAEEIIRETCKELDIEIIDLAVSVDHVHLFIKYPPKYSVSWIAKRAPSCYHGSVGHGWEVVEKYISGQKGYEKTDTVPVIAEEMAKTHKTWYNTLYNKLFGGAHQK